MTLHARGFCWFFVLAALLDVSSSRSACSAQALKLTGLSAEVQVEVDAHGIPHIYAGSWPDAARVLGYLHARDRLWQMDMFRRQASGSTAEVLGKQGLDNDTLMRR